MTFPLNPCLVLSLLQGEPRRWQPAAEQRWPHSAPWDVPGLPALTEALIQTHFQQLLPGSSCLWLPAQGGQSLPFWQLELLLLVLPMSRGLSGWMCLSFLILGAQCSVEQFASSPAVSGIVSSLALIIFI